MAMIRRYMLTTMVLPAMLLSACATTTLTAVWKDPSYQGPPRKVMVIGVAKKPVNRRIFEDEFVRRLKALGTEAVASYTVLPDRQQDDSAAVEAKMNELGADAVLITRLTDKKTVKTIVPGTVYSPPSFYGTWRDYYRYGSQVTYTPAYVAEDEYALMETNLYNAGTDKLIWSALSETEISGSDQRLIQSYVGVMVDAMADEKLFQSK